MNISSDSIQSQIQGFGLFGIFLSMLIENIGIPFPTELAFIASLGLLITHQANYAEVFITISLGHIVGACLGYGIGRWGNVRLTNIFLRSKRLHEAKAKVSLWYSKYGNATIFATRIIGYVRPWSSIIAGFVKMPFLPFLVWTTLGTVVFTFCSMLFTKYIVHLWHNYPNLHIVIVIVIGLGFFGIVLYELLRGMYARTHHKRK